MSAVILAALLGLCVGSFANVFLHRYPRGLSLLRPGSRCPRCRRPIRWRHNVPVLGWVLLRGRCHDCHARISARYPAMEAAFGALAAAAQWRFGPSAMGWEFTAFSLALLLIAWVDWETMHIYDVCTVPLGALGLTLSIQFPGAYGAWWVSAACGTGAYALMWLLGAAGEAIFKKEALGGGDVKLMAAAGAFLGWPGTAKAMVWGVLLGLPLMLAYQRLRGLHWRKPAPFGPGLCAGCALAGWDLMTGDVSLAAARAGLDALTLSAP